MSRQLGQLEDGSFIVEAIVNHRTVRGKRQFLIRWRGYGPDEDTWEAEASLSCPDIKAAYVATIPVVAKKEVGTVSRKTPGGPLQENSPKRIKTEHPSGPPALVLPAHPTTPQELTQLQHAQEIKVGTFNKFQKRKHSEILVNIKEDKEQKNRVYQYKHYLGTEPDFLQAQQSNATVVEQAKIEGDYAFFLKLYTEWNTIVKKGPFEFDPADGHYFMVHNMGPYRAQKLVLNTNCHGCGQAAKKGEFVFCHAHLTKDWLERPFCYPCVKYILYHLQGLALIPARNNQRRAIKQILGHKVEPKIKLQNL